MIILNLNGNVLYLFSTDDKCPLNSSLFRVLDPLNIVTPFAIHEKWYSVSYVSRNTDFPGSSCGNNGDRCHTDASLFSLFRLRVPRHVRYSSVFSRSM